MKYKCSRCGITTEVISDIKKHISKKNICHPSESDTTPFIIEIECKIECEYCNKKFFDTSGVKRHQKTCKLKKINRENEIIVEKDIKIKELEKELEIAHNQIIKSNVTIESSKVPNKFEETIDDLIKLIDRKVLGNTNLETIRNQSRNKYKNIFKNMSCVHCKHTGSTQVCHIKAIKDFNKLSLIEDINHISNLIGLCPNCHIDLDKHKKFEVVRTATLHSLLMKKSHD